MAHLSTPKSLRTLKTNFEEADGLGIRKSKYSSLNIMAVTSDAEFLKILEQAYEEAWEIVNSEDDWKKEAEEKGTLTNLQFL